MTKAKQTTKAPDSLKSILNLIKVKTKVDLTHYKMSTIRRRVEHQMKMKRLPTLAKYATFLKSNPEALVELYEDVFVHVTQFFRDPEAYEALKKLVFPAITKGKKRGDTLRVWTAGCSTGEEAYSLAIALTEYLHTKKLHLKLTIFATDISGLSVKYARKGVYSEKSLSKIKSKKILSHFEKINDGFRVKKEIRDLCVFSEHDIMANPPFSKMDIISCRNVLIYLNPDIQKKILDSFHFGLNKTGFLWLGTSETTGTTSKLFLPVDKKHRIYKTIPSVVKSTGRVSKVPMALAEVPKKGPKKITAKSSPEEVKVQREYFQSIMEQYESTQEELMSSNEELQCTNEELLTANDELEARNTDLFNLNEQLTRSEERFRLMVTGVRDYAIFMLDPEGKITSWNEGARRFKGYEAEEIIGKHFSQFYTEADKARNHPQYELEQAIQNGKYEEEGWRVRKDGTRFWANVVITKISDPKGRLLGFAKVTRDLTERRNAEEELKKSEERFRLMVGAVKDYAIFLLDPSGHIASWNEGARRFKGYEANEIIGKHFSTFYTQADRDRMHPEYELQIASKEGRFEEEGWRVRKDGTTFWANVVITRVNDSHGKILGFVKVTRDLTEKRRSEEELRRSEERLRLMVSAVKDYAILMLDKNGIIESWNDGAKRIKGWEASEVIGKHFSKFYLQSDIDRKHPEHELKVAGEEGRYEEEGWRLRKDNTRFWANVVITRINDASGELTGFVKVTRDLTERRRAEDALKMAYEDLERKIQERTKDLEQALKSRDEFLSIASHELKTPLTSLRLQLQISSKRISMSPDELPLLKELSKSLEIGVRQVSSLTHLVNDLLDISRIQTGVFELHRAQFNLSELVDEISQRFKEQLEHARIPLTLHLNPDLEGSWDRFRLEQVIVNLISNAIKYAPQTPLEIFTYIENGRAVMEVVDKGPGIEIDMLDKIFHRFERGNSPQNISGLGLGLFITKKIIEHHKGRISVESAPGRGARFIVELPLTE